MITLPHMPYSPAATSRRGPGRRDARTARLSLPRRGGYLLRASLPLLLLCVALVLPHPAAARMAHDLPTAPPTVATPTPTATPTAGTPTPTPTPAGSGTAGSGDACAELFGARICIPTPTSIMTDLATNVAHFWGDTFAGVTAPFAAILTYSPDLTANGSLSGIRQMQTTLAGLCAALLLFFLTLGTLAAYLSAMGRGTFHELLAPVGRGIVVTGIIAGYTPLMSTAFTLINTLADAINHIPIGASESGFALLGNALGTITDMASPVVVIKAFVVLAALLVSVLAVIVRCTALGFLDLLYIVGPLCLATYLSPQFSFIARWWWRSFFALAMYPVAYALVLKVIANVIISTGGVTQIFDQSDNFVSSLASLGLLLMIYRVPALVASCVGAGSSVFGGAASALTDAGIAAGVSLATRGLGNKVVGGTTAAARTP